VALNHKNEAQRTEEAQDVVILEEIVVL